MLRLVAQGLGNAEIADRLVVRPRTVHAHLRSILEKLGVATRTAAAHEACRHDFGVTPRSFDTGTRSALSARLGGASTAQR